MATISSEATFAMIPPPPLVPLENQAEELRADRVREGLCPHCGTKLYETIRKGVLRKKVTRPLSIAGQVVRGQCVQCLNNGGDGGDAAAIACAALAEPTLISIPAATATPILSSPLQMDTTYVGSFNSYGERHGEGELAWTNGDRYKGTPLLVSNDTSPTVSNQHTSKACSGTAFVKVKEFSVFLTARNMWETGRITKCMEMEHDVSQMATYTTECIAKANDPEMAAATMPTATCTLVNGETTK